MTDFPIETDRLLITEWHHEDWISFHPIASDPEVMRYIGQGKPWPDERIESFVAKQIQEYARYGFCLWKLIEKVSYGVVGFCGLQHLPGTDEIEIGWWLARNCWGRGLATEAARAVLRYAFEHIGLSRVVAIAQPSNQASLRVMQKLGMRYEKEVVRDGIRVVWYSIDNPGAAKN